MLFPIAIAASLATAAGALPASSTTGDSGSFTMIAIHSGNLNVHLRPISANAGGFWLGKNATTSCSLDPDVCSNNYAGIKTVVKASGSGTAALDAAAGEQQLLVSPGGFVNYMASDFHIVPESVVSPFVHTAGASANSAGTLTLPGHGVYACPGEKDEYQIKSAFNGADVSGCIGIAIGTFAGESDTYEYL